MKYMPFTDAYKDCEIVIGLVYPIGAEHSRVTSELTTKFRNNNYQVETIQVSSGIIAKKVHVKPHSNEFERISNYMDAGNKMRADSKDYGIAALGVADAIYQKRIAETSKRDPSALGRRLFIVNSLKNPEEVRRLREIYGEGFYLFALDEASKRRLDYLGRKDISPEKGLALIERDEDEKGDLDEKVGHGQNTRETFQLADFFISLDESHEKTKSDVDRIVNIIFGHPYLTPTFDEFAMHSAFMAGLRSADLSRQVGAVVAKGDEILAVGSNDCPKYGGGVYWPVRKSNRITDRDDGRDYKRGVDSNRDEQLGLVDEIIRTLDIKKNVEQVREKLLKTRLKDITEYGRVVHAEMDALLHCARNTISTKGATLYVTTFPCHNCAKHIIAAGIEKVVYVEPYPKSKAFDFYKDSISKSGDNDKVGFRPFIGVGPRKFLDFFSLRLGRGVETVRKSSDGKTFNWDQMDKNVRVRMLPLSYIDKEGLASNAFWDKGEPHEANHQGEPRKRKSKKQRGRADSQLARVEKIHRGKNSERIPKKR